MTKYIVDHVMRHFEKKNVASTNQRHADLNWVFGAIRVGNDKMERNNERANNR